MGLPSYKYMKSVYIYFTLWLVDQIMAFSCILLTLHTHVSCIFTYEFISPLHINSLAYAEIGLMQSSQNGTAQWRVRGPSVWILVTIAPLHRWKEVWIRYALPSNLTHRNSTPSFLFFAVFPIECNRKRHGRYSDTWLLHIVFFFLEYIGPQPSSRKGERS